MSRLITQLTSRTVNEDVRRAFDAWKQADAQARGAETRLALAWEGYFSHRGEPPPHELVREVSSLRAVANERLSVTMRALGTRQGGKPSA